MNFFKALALFITSYITDSARTVNALREAQKIDFKPILEDLIKTINSKVSEIRAIQGVKLEVDNFPMPQTRLEELKKAYKEMQKKANGRGIGLFVEFMENGKKQSKSLTGKDQVEAFIRRADAGEIVVL